MMTIRRLDGGDFERLHEIDVSEPITLVYRLLDGSLQPEPHDWTRPAWDRAEWEKKVAEWRRTLMPDIWFGAFVGERLAGEASMRHRLAPGMAQLTTLHVSRPFRRQSVASDLLKAVAALASESGAKAIYVSATPSESAVGFYLDQGFRATSTPDPGMYKLEPEDIHMVRPLFPDD